MKILYVVQYMAPEMGGPPSSIATLSDGLIKRGHKVEICTTDYKLTKGCINGLTAKGIKLRVFKNWFGHFHFCPSCKNYFKENIRRFDIIHLNNHWSYLNIVAHNYARKYSVPYVFSARGTFPLKPQGGRNFLLKCIYELLFGRNIIKDAGKLIALTDMEAKQYSNRHPNKKEIIKIPNPINLEKLKYKLSLYPFAKRYALNKNDRIILYAGRLHKRKGLDLLIKAFALVCGKINNIKLMIVGPDDGFLRKLRKLAKRLNLTDKVIFTGPLFGNDKYAAYTKADIFVSPARYEPFGITFLEAMAFGLPVVTINNVGLADAIKNKCGLVVNYNQKELCGAILKILSDGNMRKRMGDKGKRIVKQFDNKKIAKKMEGIYFDAMLKK